MILSFDMGRQLRRLTCLCLLFAGVAHATELQLEVLDQSGVALHGPQSLTINLYASKFSQQPIMTTQVGDAKAPEFVANGALSLDLAMLQWTPVGTLSEHNSVVDFTDLNHEVWLELVLGDEQLSQRLPMTFQHGQLKPQDHGTVVLLPTAKAMEAGELQQPSLQMAADPATFTDRSGLCTWRMTCGGTTAQMKWSRVSTGCWAGAEANMPMAVVLQGYGFDYRRYDFLQNHLARNGILSVSVSKVAGCSATTNDCGQRHIDTADAAHDFVNSSCFANNFLDNFSVSNPINRNQTAVIGHSQGGETARYLAAQLDKRSDTTVRAVVAMAPTRYTEAPIWGMDSAAYLQLWGSGDTDVLAHKVFPQHDLAGGNEWSTPTIFDLDRSMKMLVSGDHAGFADSSTNFGFGDAQRSVTQGYVNAFLRAWLRNDWQFYGGYIRGNSVPGSWINDVFSQYSSSASRRVIDNFEAVSNGTNTMGGAFWTSRMSVASKVDAANLSSTPHVGRAMRLRPSQAGGYATWELPEGQRNATSNLYLSFRIGQLTDAAASNARVWVNNGGTFSYVNVADYGGIPTPITMCQESEFLACISSEVKGFMHSVRIPLSAFSGKNDIRAVYIQFPDSTGVGKDFLVDNLELSDSFFIIFGQ